MRPHPPWSERTHSARVRRRWTPASFRPSDLRRQPCAGATVPALSLAMAYLYCRTTEAQDLVAIWLHRHGGCPLRSDGSSATGASPMARANAVDTHEEVGEGVDQRGPVHRQRAPVPSQAQLGQRTELCVGGQ